MKEILISGFADEAANNLEEQMDVLEKNGVYHIEIRNVDGKHVLQHTEAELEVLSKKLENRKFRISAIGSPVGKTKIADDFAEEIKTFKNAVAAAKILKSNYIRAFSFFLPKDEPASNYSDEVIKRISALVEIAEKNQVIFALENDSGIYGDTLERCIYILETIKSDYLKLVMDSGNFVNNNAKPYPDAYEKLKHRIGYYHIKDASVKTGKFVPCGEGDGNMVNLLKAVYKDGFSGYLSIEPHLKYLENINKAQRFTTACNALKKSLNEALGLHYELVDLDYFKNFNEEEKQ